MLVKFKDFLNEKSSLDLYIEIRNQLKKLIQNSILKSYEISNNVIKLTFFNEEFTELPLKISDNGKYLVVDDDDFWNIIVKYQELFKNSRDTENFYYNGEKYPFSKIHELIESGESEWYNKLYEDFGLENRASVLETKNGTISLYYKRPEITIGYAPKDKPIYKINRSGNITRTGETSATTVARMNCLEDYDKAFKLLYDIFFKRYMTALKRWEKENSDTISTPKEIEHAKTLKYPTLKGFVKIGLF